MTLSQQIAGWMMRAATSAPPSRHAEWALAMQREYGALDGGELGWAAGCLATSVRWRVREEWLYLALLAATPFFVDAVSDFHFKLVRNGLVSREAYIAFIRSFGPAVALLTPLPLAILLGAHRPRRIVLTIVLGCLLLQHVTNTIMAVRNLGGTFMSWWGPDATLYMLPPLVGLLASMAVWYFGAAIGAAARKRWAEKRPFS